MILSGTKKAFDTTEESTELVRKLESILNVRNVSALYRYKEFKILSDVATIEINNTVFREMIVKCGPDYACISYIKNDKDSVDVLAAFVRKEKYKKHV